MSKQHQDFLHGLNDFLNLFEIDQLTYELQEKHGNTRNNLLIKKELQVRLVNIWFDMDWEFSPKDDVQKKRSIRNMFNRGDWKSVQNVVDVLTGNYSRICPAEGQPALPTDYLEPIQRSYSQTLAILTKKIKLNSRELEMVRKGLMNVFFRLTRHPEGSLVPLVDLVNENEARYLFPDSRNPVLDWAAAVEGIFLSLKLLNVPFPAPYHVQFAMLERIDTLNQEIMKLEASYAKLFGDQGLKG
ncbi:MAG: hypothetical protein ACFFD4_08395 [Candidatus Odinarchaeota archaeon]